jgi:hypothetical protein
MYGLMLYQLRHHCQLYLPLPELKTRLRLLPVN